ncbi:MAG TPA: c-type cytochrome domain-containing protein [Phnomibacter sp.]|nr:c-type cytochrome domain-containing protein [Phnomibacter sp.]
MAKQSSRRYTLLLTVTLGMTAFLVQCTKDNTNASQVSRALVDVPDSSVFSPFYDSTKISPSDVVPDVNDIAIAPGVLSIIKTNCASDACHGGNISPRLTNYSEIKSLVVPGDPNASKLFQLITTSDLNKAMPPITYGVDLSLTDKTKIFNWIKNGAKEQPGLEDYRPAGVALLINGCTSANCHNQATVGGEWARKNLITFAPTDTVSYVYINPDNGSRTVYCQLKEPKLSEVWNKYKDSVRRFYADTVANASFRPYKTFSTPVIGASRRGPLNTYDDLLVDVFVPKSIRSNTSVVYTNPAGQRFYTRGDALNAASTLVSRIDSTLLVANPRTGVYNTAHHGDMAYGDGGLKRGEIAIVKAWYFADPNIPDVWKYGLNNAGIFKYRKTGNIIKK